MKYVIGIDEVGRGSLAGAVAVCAVCIPANLKFSSGGGFASGEKTKNLKLGKLRDSKKLTAARRERWFEYFNSHAKIRYAIAQVHPRKIEKINISGAANLAASRAYKRLSERHQMDMQKCAVFLDGGLYLGNKKKSIEEYDAQTVTKGDEKILAITIASIMAKVTRDRRMRRLSKKFPHYGFEENKGYGTRRHRAAIQNLGPTPIHRSSFLRKIKIAQTRGSD